MINIDKLIFDTLAGRRGVVLAGVGTLEVKRRGAKKLSETQIIPPQNVVVFTPDDLEGAESIISLVAAEGMSDQDAVALYGSWLEGARRADGAIAIEGVGELGERGMIVAEELHTALNPTNEEIVTMETERRSTPVWAWIVIGLLAALLVLCVLWGWKNGLFSRNDSPLPVEVAVVSLPGPTAEEIAIAEAAAAAQAATEAEAAAVAAAEPAGPRFHVIAGAFAIESNADKFIDRLKRNHSELTPEKLVNPQSGYHMVSIYQASSRREANNKMNLYWDIDLFLWIYEQR